MTEKITVTPDIRKAPDARGAEGQYYVSWGVGDDCRYLHSDGVWRDTTFNGDHHDTGYFLSKKAAQAAVDKYLNK